MRTLRCVAGVRYAQGMRPIAPAPLRGALQRRAGRRVSSGSCPEPRCTRAIEVLPDAAVWEVHQDGAVVYWHPSQQRAIQLALMFAGESGVAEVVVYDLDGALAATHLAGW